VTVELRVQARSRRNALVPAPDGRWKLCLTAPPVEGRANQALIDFFSRTLGIARSRVRILSGEKSRQKVIALDGVSEPQLRNIATTD
jgi:uncharacterized protein (TIGR00251 family)